MRIYFTKVKDIADFYTIADSEKSANEKIVNYLNDFRIHADLETIEVTLDKFNDHNFGSDSLVEIIADLDIKMQAEDLIKDNCPAYIFAIENTKVNFPEL